MPLQCVRAVHEYFRLDDRHQITLLAKRGVTRQRLRVRVDTRACRNSVADCDDRAPFGKTRAKLPVFGQSLAQSVQTFRDFFSWKTSHGLGAFVHLDPWNDPLLLKHFNKTPPVAILLPNRFVEENHTADEFAGTFCSKQDFAIHPPVLLVRRHIDAFQSLLDGSRTFVGCQNALARYDQFSCYRFQIVSFHASSPYRWVLSLLIIATNKFVAS